MLTDTQKQTLATALRAETTPIVAAAMAIRNDVFLAEWCNTASTTDAWNSEMTGRALFEATNVVKFDNILAGKRDAWKLMLDFTPLDMGRNKLRLAVVDVWGDADCIAVLQACTRKANYAELYIGGASVTEKTVTALKLNWTGTLSYNEVSNILNRY